MQVTFYRCKSMKLIGLYILFLSLENFFIFIFQYELLVSIEFSFFCNLISKHSLRNMYSLENTHIFWNLCTIGYSSQFYVLFCHCLFTSINNKCKPLIEYELQLPNYILLLILHNGVIDYSNWLVNPLG